MVSRVILQVGVHARLGSVSDLGLRLRTVGIAQWPHVGRWVGVEDLHSLGGRCLVSRYWILGYRLECCLAVGREPWLVDQVVLERGFLINYTATEFDM